MDKFVTFDHKIKNISLATYVKPGTGSRETKNRPYHGIVMYIDDVHTVDFENNKHIELKNGNILYFPKGSDYITNKPPESKGVYAINFEYIYDVDFPPIVIRTKNTQKFLNYFKEISIIYKKRSPGYQKQCTAILYNIFALMEYEYQLGYMPESSYVSISPAIEYIHLNYISKNINIDHLASLCKISTTYFRRIFNRITGISPKKYIIQLKMNYAAEQILANEHISDIAYEIGFNDSAAFSKAFKHHHGVTPSEYKNQKRFEIN